MSTSRDVFICHATEDKPEVANPLFAALTKAKIDCWYDEAEIKWGDNIIEKVNEGLRISRFVIVVLSKAFLDKDFPQQELNSVLNLEIYSKETKILPLLVVSGEQDKRKIFKALPLLNSKLYKTWDGDTNEIIQDLLTLLPEKKHANLNFPEMEMIL